jgi:coenzyme F420-reducing hydrogenase gamma subunit
MEEPLPTTSESPKKKLAIGIFSFTCCEGCSILFTEVLNDYLEKWLPLIEFRHVKALKSKNRLEDLDVAIVEGAISSLSQEKELKKIRDNSKKLVALGSCAVNGMPSSSRNDFTDEKINDRIKWYFSHFDYSDKVRKLEDVVTVDAKINGCPMDAKALLEALNGYLKEFGII